MEPTVQHVREIDTREQEWREALLVDRAERAEAEAARLQAELEKQTSELLVARLWVKELALSLDESHQRRSSLSDLGGLSRETEALLRSRLEEPSPVQKIVIVAGIVAAPWLGIAAVASVVYVLLA
jgi:hypothetical protein